MNSKLYLKKFVDDINSHVKSFLKKLELWMNFNKPINEDTSHLAIDKTSKNRYNTKSITWILPF